jgi:serine/threonine protein kinase
MKFVQGNPIISEPIIDEVRFAAADSKADKLRKAQLMLQVIQLAAYQVEVLHQRGLTHNDLTAGNILVTIVDGRVEVHILDYGLATFFDSKNRASNTFKNRVCKDWVALATLMKLLINYKLVRQENKCGASERDIVLVAKSIDMLANRSVPSVYKSLAEVLSTKIEDRPSDSEPESFLDSVGTHQFLSN